jgi:hypothetical protein
MRRVFARLARAILDRPPLVYLGLYLLLIPLFALLYCGLAAGSFHAPYAARETSAIGDMANVSENIRQSLLRSMRDNELLSLGWVVSPDNLRIDDLAVESPNLVTFEVSFFGMRYLDNRLVATVAGPQFVVRMDRRRIWIADQALVCHPVTLPPMIGAEGLTGPSRRLFFRPPRGLFQLDVVCWRWLEEERLRQLLLGWSGDPRALSGYPGRMLYFSAVTITTVGFGDIVPLSGTARLIAGLEAVVGWVVAGLFLNAIASRAAGKS